MTNQALRYAPVAIGGIGGSGTRLFAAMLQALDFAIGSDLNEALDNLWFTFLFRRISILETSDADFAELTDIFAQAMDRRAPVGEDAIETMCSIAVDAGTYDAAWVDRRIEGICEGQIAPAGRWGWKEPNTHIVAGRLLSISTASHRR